MRGLQTYVVPSWVVYPGCVLVFSVWCRCFLVVVVVVVVGVCMLVYDAIRGVF